MKQYMRVLACDFDYVVQDFVSPDEGESNYESIYAGNAYEHNLRVKPSIISNHRRLTATI